MHSNRLICTTIVLALMVVGAFVVWLTLGGGREKIGIETPAANVGSDPVTVIHTTATTAIAPANKDMIFSDFLVWAREHAKPDQTIVSAELDRGVALARERKALLAGLIESDPQHALELALPEYLVKALPVKVAEQVETPFNARGDYFLAIADTIGANVEPTMNLSRTVEIDGKTYRAFVYGKRLSQRSKYNIPLYGIVLGDAMAIHENPVQVLKPEEIAALDPKTPYTNKNGECPVSGRGAMASRVVEVGGEYTQTCCTVCPTTLTAQLSSQLEGTDPQSGSTAPAVAYSISGGTTGLKTVLVIPADFTDTPNNADLTALKPFFDNTVGGFYAEESWGQTSMTSTVTTLVHLPHTAAYYTGAGAGNAITDGKTAAINAGYSVGSYDLYVVMAPPVSSPSGVGKVNAPGAVIFMDGSTSFWGLATTAHELGHNYGCMHANSWKCTDGTIIGSGSNGEYANAFSVMGGGSLYPPHMHHDAWMKNDFGWLPNSNINTVTTSGTYVLHAFDDMTLNAAFKYVLKINNPTRSNAYWLEFRQQQTASQWLMNGIEVTWSPWGTTGDPATTSGSNWGTQILGCSSNVANAILEGPLAIGRTFVDKPNGLYITPIGKTGTVPEAMNVVVNFGAFPTNQPPVVSLMPSATSVALGTSVNFTATATDPNGDTLAYHWDFGDKSIGINGSVLSHSWAVAGQYLVRCTVTDMKGGEALAWVVITVGSPATFTISGRVATAGGQGIEGASVYQYLPVGGGKKMIMKATITNSNGDYTLVGLASGSFNIDANKGFYTLTPNFINPVVVGPNASGINFTGALITYTVTGTVTDGASAIAGVTVSDGGFKTTVTDASGNYTLNLPNGAYNLSATKAGYSFAPASLPIAVSGAALVGKNFTGTLVSVAPTVATAAKATPNPVTGTTAVLSVLGADDAGEPALVYTWSSVGPAAVTYSINATNASKTTTATFTKAGSYTITATIKDAAALTVTSVVTVTVTVNQTLTTITVAPASPLVLANGTQNFTATGKDQFGTALAIQPAFGWTVSGGGTIGPASGIFTAGSIAGGPFTVTATSGTKSGTAQVTVTTPVNQPPVIVSAATASPNPVFNLTLTTLNVFASDPDAGPSALTYTWSKVSGPGAVIFAPNGTTGASLSTATFSASGTYTLKVSVSDGAASVTSSIAGLVVTLPNAVPTVATTASATPNPITGSTTLLSLLGADDAGEPALVYTWSSVGPAAVTYSTNGTNASKNTTATFLRAGAYTFTATIKDAGNLTVTSSIAVTVNQTLTTIAVSPASPSVIIGGTQTFTASGKDQFTTAMAVAPAFTWTVSGGGVIGAATGVFTAGAVAGGPFIITATCGAKSGTAQVTITSLPNAAPTVATAASATPNPVIGTTTVLGVRGADDAGEPALIYTWSAVGPAAVTYSVNGTNASKNSTATFTKAGAYIFTATIRDAGALTVTSSVVVTVNQTLTTVSVTPLNISVVANGTQTFTAAAKDQFATAMAVAPVFGWNVSGGGTIGAASGIFTGGAIAGGPFTVTATSGAKSGTASVTVTGGGNPITASVPTVLLTTPNGSITSVSVTIQLTNSSGAAVSVGVSSSQVWLTATPSGPTAIPAGGTLTITVTGDPTGLNGTFNGTLTITNNPGGATQTIPVTFMVNTSGGRKKGGCAIGRETSFPASEFACALFLLVLLANRPNRHRA